ncbi:MAG: FAD:protein FMN transferase [Flavobacteriaceae bacterium]
MKVLVPLLFCFLVFSGMAQERKYVTVKRTVKLMGAPFDITVVAPNEELGYINIEEAIAEISRIEKKISSWQPDSETSLINANAGIKPVKVSYEVFKLIERSIKISELTDGAFDISFASLDQVWKFDGTMQYKPSAADIKKSILKVGYGNIILDEEALTVFLKLKGMKISFEAIGIGYAVDKAKELLVSRQVVGGVINASGDLTTWGTKVSGEKWLLGIANPLNKGKIFTWMPILESSVATSGNLDQFVEFKGEKFSHIIDPRTGYPSKGVSTVHVFAKSAELCDALATAIFVLGKEAGLALVNQLPLTEVILVDSQNKMYKSHGILFD